MPRNLDDILDEPAGEVGSSTKTVPNVYPKIHNVDYKIAIVGEAPGADELDLGYPFAGASGRELDKYLSKCSILRDAVFIGNICQNRPAGNKIATFDWDGPEIQSGMSVLGEELGRFRPNLIWCLGGASLHAFKCGKHDSPPKKKTKEGPQFNYPNSISDWRGSLFLSHPDSPLPFTKCVASYHPAAALRTYKWMPLILLDLLFKVCKQAKFPDLVLPHRTLDVDVNLANTLAKLDDIYLKKPAIALDIEGYVNAMSCLSIATAADHAFIIPFTRMDGTSLWDQHEETLIWRSLARVLGDPLIPKVLQNSLYDRFVLQYSYGIVMRNVVDDTMLKHWELYCELEKNLGLQCSIYTDEPYYKGDIKRQDRKTFWEYCCRDSATTFEINTKLSKWVRGSAKAHYDFNVALLNPMLYMELRGIRYDYNLARSRSIYIDRVINELQFDLDTVTSFGHPPDASGPYLLEKVRDEICWKANRDKPKSGHEDAYERCKRIIAGGLPLSKSDRGFFNIVSGQTLNVKSTQSDSPLKLYLYETLKLPRQFNDSTLTTDVEAILTLQKEATNAHQRRVLDLVHSIAELRTRASMLEIRADNDGRVRCGYNIVGTNTGRIACYTSPTGSGYNLQTIPAEFTLRPIGHPLRDGMRDLFTADEGCYLFQCDLSGADGWTVGANLKSLGDSTMLDDLLNKIKPASRIAYMLRHGNDSLKGKPREEIEELLKEIKKDDFDYFMCKCGIWGICYLMGVDRLRDLIFKESEGKLQMSRKDVSTFRDAVYSCYRPQLWHKATEKKLQSQPYPPKLTSASGHSRTFLGRYNEILGEALANEPQENTTYATNRAAYNLWHDPENRLAGDRHQLTHRGNLRGQLRVEPLHQVHDALIGQFRIADTAWAITKIRQWFNNKLIIAGQPIIIPFEGTYGLNWAMDTRSKVGSI